MLVDSFACSSVSVMLCLTAVKLYMSGVDAEASAWNADLLLPNVMAKSHLKLHAYALHTNAQDVLHT